MANIDIRIYIYDRGLSWSGNKILSKAVIHCRHNEDYSIIYLLKLSIL